MYYIQGNIHITNERERERERKRKDSVLFSLLEQNCTHSCDGERERENEREAEEEEEKRSISSILIQ